MFNNKTGGTLKVKNILVSQPKPANFEKSPYASLSNKFNVNIDFEKFITIEGISSKEFRMNKQSLNGYTAVILTSRHAVDHFFRIAKELRYEIPPSLKYFCISESTAYYLQKYIQYRKRKTFFGKQRFSDLMDVIKKHPEEKYFVPSSDIHKQSMFDMLNKEKINYSRGIIYKTVASNLSHIDVNKYDLLIFFSPAGIKSLLQNFPDFEQGEKLIGAFGPTTLKAIKDAGLRIDIAAPTKTAPSMTMAIEEYLLKEARNRRRKIKK